MKLPLRPIPFLIGLFGGFAALCWLGATLESPHLKSQFVRVHQRIDLDSGYYLTAREMISIVRARIAPATKAYVIIGGSSTFNGVGQHESLVWTRHLQDQLGPEFRVINLALRGGSMFASGNVAAEWLLAQSLPVIYVANGSDRQLTDPSGGSRHRYVVLDAWHRGYLLPWPKRDRVLRASVFDTALGVRSDALGAALNSYLFFNDLWNYVTYEVTALNWNFLLLPDWYLPRRRVRDPELTEKQRDHHRYNQADREMKVMTIIGDRTVNSLIPDSAVRNTIEHLFPPRLRSITVGVIDLQSPYYRDQLDPVRQKAIIDWGRSLTRAMEQAGLHRALVATEDFIAEDYVDLVHFSAAGGEKLARIMAGEIRAAARKLGYLP